MTVKKSPSESSRLPTDSPCIDVCRMNAAGLCEGCFRTLDEIARWSSMSDKEKLEVNGQLEQRAFVD